MNMTARPSTDRRADERDASNASPISSRCEGLIYARRLVVARVSISILRRKNKPRRIMHFGVRLALVAHAAAAAAGSRPQCLSAATSKEARFPQSHGSAQRSAEAAREAIHEGVERRHRPGPTIRSSAPVSASRSTICFIIALADSVPTRLNEFAILIIGRQWRCRSNGSRMRRSRPRRPVGRIIADLRPQPAVENADDEAIVYDFVTKRPRPKGLDETYARARSVQRSADRRFTAVAGNYVMVAMICDGRGDRAAGQGRAVQGRRE